MIADLLNHHLLGTLLLGIEWMDPAWWLERFGVERNGIPLAEHIERYGLPDELRELIGDLPPVVV